MREEERTIGEERETVGENEPNRASFSFI